MTSTHLCNQLSFAAESLRKTALEVAKLELEFRRPGGSPTDMLLTNWGHSNATVEMLVSHLLRAGLRYAAEKLRGLGMLSMYCLLRHHLHTRKIIRFSRFSPKVPKGRSNLPLAGTLGEPA